MGDELALDESFFGTIILIFGIPLIALFFINTYRGNPNVFNTYDPYEHSSLKKSKVRCHFYFGEKY